MLTMRCEDVGRDLSAYHDEELPVGERIAIAAHLENCPGCAIEANDLASIREAMLLSRHREQVAWGPVLARLQSDVVQRLAAEEKVSFANRLSAILEDRPRALATMGASLAACVLVIFGMCQLGFGTVDHPDSMAALLAQQKNAWEGRVEGPVRPPRVKPETIMPAAVMNQGDSDESEAAFSAMVGSDGRLDKLEFLGQYAVDPVEPAVSKRLEADLIAAASTASFQPARRAAGNAVPINVVWVVTHRTVRAAAQSRIEVTVTSTFRLAPQQRLPARKPSPKTA